MRIIAPGLKDVEIMDCMINFDANGDNVISIEEFKRKLIYGMQQDNNYNPHNEKAEKLIGFLKKVIKDNNLNLIDIFKNFDKQGS